MGVQVHDLRAGQRPVDTGPKLLRGRHQAGRPRGRYIVVDEPPVLPTDVQDRGPGLDVGDDGHRQPVWLAVAGFWLSQRPRWWPLTRTKRERVRRGGVTAGPDARRGKV